jgi:drug/metabolite transporter (DMT)-like permease
VTKGKNKAAILTEISLILAAIFWGTNYAATKFAALSIPPLSIVALRFVVGGLLMYAVLRILEPGSRPGRKDLLRMGGLGCFGVVLAQTSFTFGVSMTRAANTGLIFATAPVWGLLLGLLLGLERPTWGGMVGVALSILGVAIVFWEGLTGARGADLGGDLLVLGFLFGLIFFMPFLGAAIGAGTGALSGSLADVGIDDDFIRQVREKVTPGTSALFALTSGATAPDRVIDELRQYDFEIISTNLPEEQEKQPREAFAQE